MGVPPQPTASNAVLALVLGILGIVLCPVLSPFALVLGKRAEEEVDASGGTIGGRGLATAGKITGIVGSVLLGLWVALIVVGIILFVIAGLAIDDGSASTFTTVFVA
jgi:hypothetical protein